ncbi:MAG TPA: methyltransferase domain-containing protein [Nanoarchaeota archaeon]|nr:methyltransferase domain-containing protein [Nanoarchaeota archaeon]
MGRIKYNKPDYETGKGEFQLAYHYEMVSDAERVGQFKKAINRVCKGKVVLEIGHGTGLMSILAAKAGAKKVYAVEIDPKVYALAKSNIERGGYKNIILVNKDIRKFAPPEKIDVVIAELLSTCLVNEPEVSVMNLIQKHLAPNAALLPHMVVNIVDGANTDYVFEGIEVRTPYFEFAGIKKARIITESKCFKTVEFNKENPLEVDEIVTLKAMAKAKINCLRFTSLVNIHDDINFYSTDSLMPPVVVPLKNEIMVEQGQEIKIRIRYRYNTDWDKGSFEAVE